MSLRAVKVRGKSSFLSIKAQRVKRKQGGRLYFPLYIVLKKYSQFSHGMGSALLRLLEPYMKHTLPQP